MSSLLKKILLSAASMSFCAVSAWAVSGSGTENNPYYGEISGDSIFSETEANTVYVGTNEVYDPDTGERADAMPLGGSTTNSYFESGVHTYLSNIVINDGGIWLTNGYSYTSSSPTEYTFAGNISGTGNWIVSFEDPDTGYTVNHHYIFTGDMSGWSGALNIITNNTSDHVYYGNGGTAATNENVTGTGGVEVNGGITFNYTASADGESAITIGNSVLDATTIEFAGSVDYIVNSRVVGYGSLTLTISNTGTTEFTGHIEVGTLTISAGTTKFSGTGSATADTVSFTATGTSYLDYSGLEEGGSLTIGTLTIGGTGTLEVTGSDSGTINTVSFTAAGTLAVADGSTLTVGSVSDRSSGVAAHLKIGEGSTLNVTGSITFGTASANTTFSEISGAGAGSSTLIVNSLEVGVTSSGASTEASDVTLVVGAISTSGNSGTTDNLYLRDVTLGFTNETATVSGVGLYLGHHQDSTWGGTTTDVYTTTINTGKYDAETGAFSDTEGYAIAISSTISGSGALVKDGAGSLTLSGANGFSGGLTIAEGAVIATNNSALGTGAVSVEGGQLEIDYDVTISNAISVTLCEAYFDTYALTGEGTIETDVITLVVDAATLQLLEENETYTFYIYDPDLTVSDDIFDLTDLEEYFTDISLSDGVLTVTYTPEPSMVGLLFGFASVGLVATRRRRRVSSATK